MIESFFFGEDGKELFGTYHAPSGIGGDVLTVICPPLFAEFMSTQAALRDLAISLSTAGQHVMRFDYRGTGDSSGDIADSTVTDWVDDIVAAADEGVDITGAGRVNLVGVRLGGLLMCRALPRIDAIDKVVLWDVVCDGADYLDTLRAISRRLVGRNPYLRGAERAAATNDYGGQGIGEPMVEELRALQSDVLGNLNGAAYEVIATDDRYAPPQDVANVTQVPFPCNWGTDSEALLMPQPVLERIRESLVSR